ncbi:MAG: S41 family peptidase [Bacteroidales bacterium]|nr:S41 family peptidase [Bacteroidales bacterium]MBN2634548.1 S41 family peptidase [Bacteroidales bacterium]
MNRNNPAKTIFLPLLIAFSVVTGILIGIYLPRKTSLPQNTGIRARNDKINMILNTITSDYVDDVKREDLVETTIPAILKNLDPHSVYIPARDLKKANESIQGNFEGIGISFNMMTDTILVISTIPGGPSEKIGLQAGDKILYVNDSLIAGKGISDEDVMGMLKGPRGTIVNVKVLRRGHPDLLSFSITRDKIPIYSVDVAYMINETTGYIKINNFAESTYSEFMTGLRELKNRNMTKLILDLRGNSGGVMDASIQIANEFLQKDQLIVYTKGRAQMRNEARATGDGEFEKGDLVILIDEWSASASEILAGAVQDNDRGTIIGRRSFGKGLVQEPVIFPDGSGMRLTIARYYTPSGRSIQKPYDNGFEEYYEDLNKRFTNGEFGNSDSIRFADSLKFKTIGGRTVYGGGGIMPDHFVPVDTTGLTYYFMRVRPLIYQFALIYTEENRELLKQHLEADEFEKFLDKQGLIGQFIRYATVNNVAPDPEGLKESSFLIHTQIKAYIARNILDNKGFYPIWQNIDKTLLYAIKYLEKNDQAG